jgi:hypothetical protein
VFQKHMTQDDLEQAELDLQETATAAAKRFFDEEGCDSWQAITLLRVALETAKRETNYGHQDMLSLVEALLLGYPTRLLVQ